MGLLAEPGKETGSEEDEGQGPLGLLALEAVLSLCTLPGYNSRAIQTCVCGGKGDAAENKSEQSQVPALRELTFQWEETDSKYTSKV